MGSDHTPTHITYNEPAYSENSGIPRWKIELADWRKYKENCRSLITTHIITDDINTFNNNIIQAINKAADTSMPQTKPNKHIKYKYLPYWNNKCKESIHNRNRARNKMNKTKDLHDCINYRRLKGIAQHTIKSTSKQYWQDYCNTLDSSSDLASVWRMSKKMNGINSKGKNINLVSNNIPIVTNKEKADLLGKTFSDISSDGNYNDTFRAHMAHIETHQQHLFTDDRTDASKYPELNEPYTFHELCSAVKQSKKNKSPGEDRISYEMLQHLPNKSLKVILKLYNQIYTSGKIPQMWKHSIVIGFPKPSKDETLPTSYRPISLTSTLCKIFERLATNRLAYVLEKHSLLSNIQSGFRKNRSTIDQILRLQDQINKYLNNNGYSLGIFLDFEKAFDMVWKNGLLIKLKRLNITGNMFNFINDFLTDRTLQVRVGDALSDIFQLQNGTAQGSVISPLLFLIMINDLPDRLTNIESTLFADDSAVIKSGKNLKFITKQVQNNLNNIEQWCDEWGFKVSMDKTVGIIFTRKYAEKVVLKYKCQTLKMVNSTKFLGLIFDSKLTWSEHIKYIEGKCNKRINLMRSVASNTWGASKKSLLTIYRALIRSVLDYGSCAFDSAYKVRKDVLDKIQAKALRIACGAMAGTPSSALQIECGELPLQLRREQQMVKYAIKIKATTDHPASAVMRDGWTNHYGKYNNNSQPFMNKVKPFFDLHNYTCTDERLADTPPWQQKQPCVDMALSDVVSKKENPTLIKQVASAHIEDNYRSHLQIFTDGSKTSDGKVSSAVYVPELKVEIGKRITDKVSIYAGEITAIKLAIDCVRTNEHSIDKSVVILTDSLSSLQSIQSGHSTSRPQLLNQILATLDNTQTHITFAWVPSHVGVQGNTKADALAAVAIASPSVELDIGIGLEEVYSLAETYILDKWQAHWSGSQTGKHYRAIEPFISTKVKYTHSIGSKEVAINRLRFGTCQLNHHLLKLGRHADGLCEACGKPETVEHFLIECPHGKVSKKVNLTCSRLGIPATIQTVLTNATVIIAVLRNTERKI